MVSILLLHLRQSFCNWSFLENHIIIHMNEVVFSQYDVDVCPAWKHTRIPLQYPLLRNQDSFRWTFESYRLQDILNLCWVAVGQVYLFVILDTQCIQSLQLFFSEQPPGHIKFRIDESIFENKQFPFYFWAIYSLVWLYYCLIKVLNALNSECLKGLGLLPGLDECLAEVV